MRKICLAMSAALLALAAEGQTREIENGPVRARVVGRRHLRPEPAGAVYIPGETAYVPAPAGNVPAWVENVPFNIRYNGNRPTLGPNGCYYGDYGQTHGWGFPGGRWDPSLARD
jgi:hypothetical protein